MNIEKELLYKAKNKQTKIVFPEAEFSLRVRKAVREILKHNIAKPVLIGDVKKLSEDLSKEELEKCDVFNPQNCSFADELAKNVYEIRKNKGVTFETAKTLILDPIYFANALLVSGYADGIVCGAEVSTAKTLKPALQIVKCKNGLVSSYFLFSGKNQVTDEAFLMGDCGVIEMPNSQELCVIAENMLHEFDKLGLKNPKIAFLSYSTNGSAKSDATEKVKNAYDLFKSKYPQIDAVGEVQFDASIKENVSKVKMPNYNFTKPANIFVMPDLNAGNIGYKMVQYFGGIKAIGPITSGFNKPVNDLSRGCTVEDIILLTAITSLQVE